MTKMISVGLLAAGIVLLIFGMNASDSLGSDLSRFFTGNPTDKTVWMLAGGALLSVIGAVGLLRGGK